MAITDKEQGVWSNSNQVYNKIMEGDIWSYTGADAYFIWGVGSKGRLGQNDTDSRSSPTQIPGSTWSALPHSNLGIGYMGGIKSDGTLWTWGGNDRGNLGFNQASTPSSRSSPKQVGEDTDWHHGSAGADFMFAVKTNGTLWSWGYGKWYGQLAQGSQSSFSSPRQVGTGTDWAYDSFQKIAMGSQKAGAIKQDGTLWMMGYNSNGQLGLNDQARRSSPTQIPGTWEYVSTANMETLAKKSDGTLWSWGYGGQGGLGNNTSSGNASRSSPIQVGGDMIIRDGERQMIAAYSVNAAMGKM